MNNPINGLSTEEVISSLSAHIAIIDRQGTIIMVNEAWDEFAKKNDNGQPSLTGVGVNYLEVCLDSAKAGDEHALKAHEGIQSVLSANQKEFHQEYPCHSKTEKRWFSMHVTPVVNNELGAVVVHENITHRKLAEIALQDLNMELEKKVAERTKKLKENEVILRASLKKERELGELKSRFVSMASHEFRTPLSSILSSAKLIGRYEKGEQQTQRTKHINRIESSVNNLTSILNDFLSLEKLESGKINYQPVVVDFEKYMLPILDEFKLSIEDPQQIIFTHEGQKEVQIDEHLVKNILINLLSNAVKYSPKGKEIELLSKNENELLQIFVKDQGIGIPKADHQYMFTRFFRATNVENIQGTGLGLTIAKRYLHLMGGNIDFESEVFKGTIFKVEIPQ